MLPQQNSHHSSMPKNPLVEEWKRSGSSLSYGGWLERELMEARKDAEQLRATLRRVLEPTTSCIDSMAFRFRHDFGLLSHAEQEAVRRQMRQLHEEATGRGFHFILGVDQEVRG